MTTVGELFPKCRKLAYDARQQVAMMASAASASSTASSSTLELILQDLHQQLHVMETDLLVKETPAQRAVWKQKILELRQEASRLQQQAASRHDSYARQRDELMLRRRRPATNNDMSQLTAEADALQNSQVAVSRLISQADANYQELKEQRQRLRGVRKVLTDIGSSLGITQATMRIIERRDITDAYLVAAGMVVTLLVLYFVWLY